MYNVDDFTELYYDENYRLLFNLRACTQNFRDRAYISFDAAFGEYILSAASRIYVAHRCALVHGKERLKQKLQDNSLSFCSFLLLVN